MDVTLSAPVHPAGSRKVSSTSTTTTTARPAPSLTALPFQILVHIASHCHSHPLRPYPSSHSPLSFTRTPLPQSLLNLALTSPLLSLAVSLSLPPSRLSHLSILDEGRHWQTWLHTLYYYHRSSLCVRGLDDVAPGHLHRSLVECGEHFAFFTSCTAPLPDVRALARASSRLSMLSTLNVHLKVLDVGEATFRRARRVYMTDALSYTAVSSTLSTFDASLARVLHAAQHSLEQLSLAAGNSCVSILRTRSLHFTNLHTLTLYTLPNRRCAHDVLDLTSECFPPSALLSALLPCIPRHQVRTLTLCNLSDGAAADVAFAPDAESLFSTVRTLHVSSAPHSEFHSSSILAGLISRFRSIHTLHIHALLSSAAISSIITSCPLLRDVHLQTVPLHSHVHMDNDITYVVRDMISSFASSLVSFSFPHVSYFELPVLATARHVTRLRSLQLSAGGAPEHVTALVSLIEANKQLEVLKLLLYEDPVAKGLFGVRGWPKIAHCVAKHPNLQSIVLDDGNAGYTEEQSCDKDLFEYLPAHEEPVFLQAVHTMVTAVASRLNFLELRLVLSKASFKCAGEAAATVFDAVANAGCQEVKEVVAQFRVRVPCSRWRWEWGTEGELKHGVERLERAKKQVWKQCKKVCRLDDGRLLQEAKAAVDRNEAEDGGVDVFDDAFAK